MPMKKFRGRPSPGQEAADSEEECRGERRAVQEGARTADREQVVAGRHRLPRTKGAVSNTGEILGAGEAPPHPPCCVFQRTVWAMVQRTHLLLLSGAAVGDGESGEGLAAVEIVIRHEQLHHRGLPESRQEPVQPESPLAKNLRSTTLWALSIQQPAYAPFKSISWMRFWPRWPE